MLSKEVSCRSMKIAESNKSLMQEDAILKNATRWQVGRKRATCSMAFAFRKPATVGSYSNWEAPLGRVFSPRPCNDRTLGWNSQSCYLNIPKLPKAKAPSSRRPKRPVRRERMSWSWWLFLPFVPCGCKPLVRISLGVKNYKVFVFCFLFSSHGWRWN